jgi:hypothetical protein
MSSVHRSIAYPEDKNVKQIPREGHLSTTQTQVRASDMPRKVAGSALRRERKEQRKAGISGEKLRRAKDSFITGKFLHFQNILASKRTLFDVADSRNKVRSAYRTQYNSLVVLTACRAGRIKVACALFNEQHAEFLPTVLKVGPQQSRCRHGHHQLLPPEVSLTAILILRHHRSHAHKPKSCLLELSRSQGRRFVCVTEQKAELSRHYGHLDSGGRSQTAVAQVMNANVTSDERPE